MSGYVSAASLALAAIGAATSAYSSHQAGKAQQAQANYQAAQAEANARAARQQAEVETAQKAREVQQTMGTQTAALAASGADISDMDTSAQNILGDTAQWGDYDVRMTRYNGEVKAWNYENQAQGYLAEGKQASRAGAIGAGASLLNGASKVAGDWYTYKKNGAWG